MKRIEAHDSLTFSRRYFSWKNKVAEEQEDDDLGETAMGFTTKSTEKQSSISSPAPRRKLSLMAVPKLRFALSVGLGRNRTQYSSGLGTKVLGTLYGHRRGHVHLAFQENFKQKPAFLVELATPTSILVKEMASGLVRIVLECEKSKEKKPIKLLDELIWKTYCNGRKCGYAIHRECNSVEWKVLNSIGPISMGAGVLPTAADDGNSDGEMMFMRAKFERVIGSKDSEAFYMMNPDGNGGPELSLYLLRI